MRFVALLALSACCCLSWADRLINIPLGRKVPFRTVRLEGMVQPSDPEMTRWFLDLGLTPLFDATIRHDSLGGGARTTTFDFAFNYIAPVTDFNPGLSVGILDALDETSDRRRLYFVATTRVGLVSTLTSLPPAEVTLGGTVGNHGRAFVGVLLPFGKAFRLMAEHDGYRINAGLELRPMPDLAIRGIVRDHTPQLSAQWTQRF